MWQDLRYSMRTLARQPAFTTTAILVLALGIGLNTAMFTLVNALLFRPLAAHEPHRLRFVFLTDPGVPGYYSGIRYEDFQQLRERRDVFQDLLARGADTAWITAAGDARRLRGELVSGNYFDVLGARPALGRGLTPEDDSPAAEPVVVIAEGMWRARFHADPAILGDPITIDNRLFTVVGVMPASFKGTLGAWEASQYWVPLRQRALDRECRSPGFLKDAGFALIGRLAGDVTAARAQAALSTLRLRHTSIPADATPRDRLWTPTLRESGRVTMPFDDGGRIVPERLAAALMMVMALVLVIAAANLAGMLTARGVARQSEIATRLALGAGRWRIVRQLVVEGIALSLAGGVLGIAFAQWLVDGFVSSVPANFNRFDLSGFAPVQAIAIDAPVDARVIMFTLVACLLAGLLVSVAPALHASRTGALGIASAGSTASRPVSRRLRHSVVVPQVCVSLALLLVAGLLTRTLLQAEATEHGYDVDGVMSVMFQVPRPGCRQQRETPEELRAFLESMKRIRQRILTVASDTEGITHVALSDVLPLESARVMSAWVMARAGIKGQNQFQWISRATVTSAYFDTMRIPMVAGRQFRTGDLQERPRVAIVSEGLARVMWGQGNPLGQQITFREPNSARAPEWLEVVGVVKDVRSPLSAGEWSRPAAYVPPGGSPWFRVLVARGTLAPADLVSSLRKAVLAAEPSATLGYSGSIRQSIDGYLYPRRLVATVLGMAGLTGLMLAAIGVYGVVSYSVAQRVREIGIRITLGAGRSDIIRLIVGEGARVAGLGTALGLVLGFIAVRVVSNTVAALPSLDPATVIAVPLVLAAIVLLAGYLPARRAGRVDPIVALRDL
jgi:putative ABC transport system permease protein